MDDDIILVKGRNCIWAVFKPKDDVPEGPLRDLDPYPNPRDFIAPRRGRKKKA